MIPDGCGASPGAETEGVRAQLRDLAAPAPELRVLVLAPTRNDAALTAQFLQSAGLAAEICANLAELCARIAGGCGAVVLAEEALAVPSIDILLTTLARQPSWSDLPLVIITGVAEARLPRGRLARLGPVGNVSIVERPVRPETLVSACEVALRSRRRQYEVRTLIAQAKEADRQKDEFLAMLAHELRNPLASVASATSLLQSEPDVAERSWALKVIERQSRQLGRLIDDLLDVSRINTGKIRLRREKIDAALILDQASEAARPLIKARGHQLTCRYERGALWLDADPLRIEQIVLNLLHNSAKYTPTNGQVTLSAWRWEDEIFITVEDNGIGIAPERLPEMFRLFAQGERSIARSEGGLGVGLTIVQRLAELHGGRVEAHSDGPRLGSVFTVRLPALPAHLLPLPTAPVPLAPGSLFSKLRLLIVDDNADTAGALAKLLRRAGHEVAVAHDGLEALDCARRQSPEVVILDIGLPGMDGYEVARRLREELARDELLMIAVTGYGQDQDREHALQNGFDHHLVKPVDITELKRLLVRKNTAPSIE